MAIILYFSKNLKENPLYKCCYKKFSVYLKEENGIVNILTNRNLSYNGNAVVFYLVFILTLKYIVLGVV